LSSLPSGLRAAAPDAAAVSLQAAAAVSRCLVRLWQPQEPHKSTQHGRNSRSGWCGLVCRCRLSQPSSTCGGFECGRRCSAGRSSCRPLSRSAVAAAEAAGSAPAGPKCPIRMLSIGVRLPPRLPSSTCGSFGCSRRFPVRHSSCPLFSWSAAAAVGATSARPECLIRLEGIAVRLPPWLPFFSAAVVPSDLAADVIGAVSSRSRPLSWLVAAATGAARAAVAATARPDFPMRLI
jgi:hypothetical protein